MGQTSALSFLPVNVADLGKSLILGLSKSLFNKRTMKELNLDQFPIPTVTLITNVVDSHNPHLLSLSSGGLTGLKSRC